MTVESRQPDNMYAPYSPSIDAIVCTLSPVPCSEHDLGYRGFGGALLVWVALDIRRIKYRFLFFFVLNKWKQERGA